MPQTSDVMSKHLAFFFRFFDSRSGDPKRISYTVSKTRPGQSGPIIPLPGFQTAVREERRPDPFLPGFCVSCWNGFFVRTELNTIFWGAGRGVKWSFLHSGQLNVIKKTGWGYVAMEENGPKGLNMTHDSTRLHRTRCRNLKIAVAKDHPHALFADIHSTNLPICSRFTAWRWMQDDPGIVQPRQFAQSQELKNSGDPRIRCEIER